MHISRTTTTILSLLLIQQQTKLRPRYLSVSVLKELQSVPDGTKVYVANNDSNNISVIDTSTNNVTANMYGVFNPYGIAVSRMEQKYMWRTNTKIPSL